MGFKEIFVFGVVGCVAIYHRRSRQLTTTPTSDRQQIIFLWILAVALPSLAIAWTTLNQASIPLILAAIAFLLGVWLYGNWSPTSSLNAIANPNLPDLSLTEIEEKQLKNCFPPVIYQLKNLEYRPQEIYCRGNLRSANLKTAYDRINQNIQKIFGDRFICHLKESPLKNLGSGFGIRQNDLQNELQNPTNYSFYLIPSGDRPKAQSKAQSNTQSSQRWLISISSIIFSAVTVLAAGANIYQIEDLTFTNLQQGLPYLFSLGSIFIARAIAKYYLAKYYLDKNHQIKIDPPLLLPCIGGFGILGTVTIETNPDLNQTISRRALFDLAAIPAIVGLVISIILLLLGNWILVPANSLSNDLAIGDPAILLMPNLATFTFKSSIFANLGQSLFQAIFGLAKISNSSQILALSPLTLAGWTGLALNALQLMPFDLLDGGNLAIAMFGHRQAVQIARIARLVILAIALLAQPWLRIYSLLLFLLPNPRPLILNEGIEIDKNRDFIGLALMAIALLIILPMPKSF
jgi:hypothetical protein